jgi:amino acid adenylation domain-containing protein
MTTAELLSHLRSLDVKVWADNGQLFCNGPKGVLTPILRDAIIERKAEILAHLDNAANGEKSRQWPLQRAARGGDLPLSFAQQRLWFLDQLEPNSSVYNVPSRLHLKGPLDIAVLEQSLNEIVRRHEALRTTFSTVDGEPVQVISPLLILPLPGVDLSDRSESEREDEARRLAAEEAGRPFDLAQGPLVRVMLLRLGEKEHVLLLTMHHIVSDGWSMGILFRELSVLYGAFTHGKSSPLPDLPVQYADYALWQREWMQGEVLLTQLSYWKKQLDNVPTLELPTDRPRPALQSFRGKRESIELSKELSQGLKALSRKQGVTLYMTLLAAFQTLLYRYTGQEDIVVGSPIANRNRQEIEGLIGFFVNTLALRTDLSGNPTFKQLLARVREVALGAYAHQDLPFEKLVEELRPERNLSRSPLFQVMFVLQNAPSVTPGFEGLSVTPVQLGRDTAKFDLTLSMREEAEGLRGALEYSTDLFDGVTIERMIRHFQTLLESIVANPDQCISDLPILSESERHQLLAEWNDTKRDYPKDHCIHELFEAQVERSPDAVAVVFEGKQLTYRELNQQANQLARFLRKLGVEPRAFIGICMERSLETVIAALAILKAGGVYVPPDPEYPKERLAFILRDIRTSTLLTQQRLLNRLPEAKTLRVCIDTSWESIGQESGENLYREASANDLVYVIYTSGSTGTPKGVAVTHRAVNRLVMNTDYAQLTSGDVVAQAANFSFDAATFELWGALLHGARLVVIPQEVALSPNALAAQIENQGITTMFVTTALFNQLVESIPTALGKLYHLLFGGEAVDPRRVKELLHKSPPKRLLHVYGPTETTTFASWYLVEDMTENAVTIPIGRPIANTQIYLLDKYLHPVPIGVTGELHIGGDGLARGYVNRPELTAEKFIPDPFSDEPGARLYKTGDLARYLPDGSNIEFLGRIDHQVKVRGYRIELGEIETVLGQHPAVREAVVLTREDDPDDKRLVAYVVLRQEPAPTVNELRSFLKKKLPDYMVPSALVSLESLPMTPNGKTDRRTLPVPNRDTRDGNPDYIAPVKTVEHQLKQIWEDLLGVRPIGILDNFFDLGGHSLLAVQMMHRVEQVCGVQVPLSTLLVAPTIESLGKALVQQRLEESESRVVRVQSGEDKHPFFFLHGEFRAGGIFCFNLARGLGKDQPFYALTPYGLNRQSDTVPRTVEAMAKAYIEAVRTVQPEGPYLLGGFCNGGTVAFEMARQLHGCGQKVDLVVLIAAQGRNAPGMRILQCLTDGVGYLLGLKSEEKISLFVVLRYYIRRMKNVARLPLGEQLAWALCLAKKRIWRVTRSFAAAGSPRECVALDQAGQHENWEEDALVKIYFRALDSYVPRPYSGRVVLFCPAGEYTANLKDPTMGWGKAAPNLEVQMVPGDHVTCITRYVKTLADKMTVCLDQAQGNGRRDRSI